MKIVCGLVQNSKYFMTCPDMKISCMMEDLILTNERQRS